MNLLHQQVYHARFGKGEITGQSRQQLSVRFDTPDITRRFLFPAAFFGHLTLCDPQAQLLLEQNLHGSPEEAQILRRRALSQAIRQTEAERLLLLSRRRPLVRRQLPAKNRRSSAAAAAQAQPLSENTASSANQGA